MDRADWDERYAGTELVWTADANRFVVEQVTGLTAGRALDVACGEGRNAVWLAEQGWEATGVDFSAAGLDKGRHLAAARGVDVTWVEADVTAWDPPAGAFDLVVVCYLQLPAPARRAAAARAVAALAPGGTLVWVGHDLDNLERGVGGPREASVLHTADDLVADLHAADPGLVVERAGQVLRPVTKEGQAGDAVDTLVRVRRPS
ncbi:MAG: class I SAM-dependent methyltransferase [Acidimicrobiales bacterium]|nr:class I SAM-dependent methyltransferase [Acidimicrobiales bacterium]